MVDAVDLSLPVRADLMGVARFAVATMASRAEFDMEEIEDLRLAVDELCVSVVDGDTDGHLQIHFERDEDQIEVACCFVPPSRRRDETVEEGEGVELSRRIIASLADDHGQGLSGGHPRAWLRKRRAL